MERFTITSPKNMSVLDSQISIKKRHNRKRSKSATKQQSKYLLNQSESKHPTIKSVMAQNKQPLQQQSRNKVDFLQKSSQQNGHYGHDSLEIRDFGDYPIDRLSRNIKAFRFVLKNNIKQSKRISMQSIFQDYGDSQKQYDENFLKNIADTASIDIESQLYESALRSRGSNRYQQSALGAKLSQNLSVQQPANIKSLPSKSRPSKQTFQIFNVEYTYVGEINANNEPQGAGQLYQVDYSQSASQKQFRQNISASQQNKQSQSLSSTPANQKLFIQAEFQHGQIKSKDCLIISSFGHYYRGGFEEHNLNGKGVLCLKRGSKSSNSQNNALSMGEGLQQIFKGTFSQGLLEGRGERHYPDGGIFQGFFLKGKRQGKGKMTWKSSAPPSSLQKDSIHSRQISFDGVFQNDEMNGIGYLKTPNYEYWGPFSRNMKQGKGTIKFKDGRKFQGWFEKDQIHGYGQLKHPNGLIQKGIFPQVVKQNPKK